MSTPGGVAFQPFAVSPDTPGTKRASRIFTQFLVDIEHTLQWLNNAFSGGKAIFCVSGSTVTVAFNGVTPSGCIGIELGAVPAADVNPPAGTSTIGTRPPTSGNLPGMSTGMSSPGNPTSLPGMSSTFNSLYSPSIIPPAPESSNPGSRPTTPPVASIVMMESTSNSVPSSTSVESSPSASESAYSAPTTTGTPNCYDRSPFDGTVNENYLILCDTNLPGYDLEAVAASDIAECIDACSSYPPSSQGTCVAIAFDIVSQGCPEFRVLLIVSIARQCESVPSQICHRYR